MRTKRTVLARWLTFWRVLSGLLLLSAILLPGRPSWAQEIPADLTPPEQLEAVTAANGRNVRLLGRVRSVPLLGLGYWGIQTDLHNTRLVLVLDQAVLPDGVLPVGSWVRANATINLLGVMVATKIELDDYEPGQVVVRLAPGVAPTVIAVRYNLTNRETVLLSGNIHLYTTPSPNDDIEWLIDQMENDSDIVWAEPNFIGRPPEGDPYKTWGWGGMDPAAYTNHQAYSQVNLAPAQTHYRGDGIVVAVLDTGIDRHHPALAGRWLSGSDMVADDDQPQDEGSGIGWGHGTHIAGVITHIAPNARVLPVRVLDTNGRGNTFTLAYAIEWAVQRGADVINLSLGTPYDSKVLRETVAWAQSQGTILVAAAGNDSTNAIQYPVGYEGVLGVAAVTPAGQKADFSNFGSWVELAAPGVAITSTMISAQGSGYAAWSGTSMATAFVSGAAALARQRLPHAPVAEVTNLLVQHGRDINGANGNYSGQVGKLLDIGQALVPTSTASAVALEATSDAAVQEPVANTIMLYLPLTMSD
jgi:thermitase